MNSQDLSAFEQQFETALSFHSQSRLSEAIEVLLRLFSQKPDYPPVVGLLGAYLWENKELERALPILKRSAQLSPRSQVTSLALFHTLWGLGQQDEAFEEMKRFIRATGKRSKEYDFVLAELREKDVEN